MDGLTLEALGPVTLSHPTLLEAAPLMAAGKPCTPPYYGVRCLIAPGPALDALRGAIAEAKAQRWPYGPPSHVFDPLMPGDQIGLDPGLQTFYARAPADSPPTLYTATGGDVAPFDRQADRHLLRNGAEALVTVELTAEQPVPWGGSVRITLLALALTGRGQQSDNNADAFRAALATAA
jgi:hypothetical protein